MQKLKDGGFIREEMHPELWANVVPLTKRNGQICVCIDFGDLIDACPKDYFPLPMTKRKIGSTFCYVSISFVNGFSGYNKIK